MLEFPAHPQRAEPPMRKMTLREYARFSESCLHANPSITARNCLTKRADEKTMKPFRLRPRRAEKP